MKKNLIFLTLLISVLLISVVSAGITGYLVRGGALTDSGYTAKLEKVEGTTAIVNVRTPTGETELVRVEEGRTAMVGEAEISVANLKRGTLFTRGGANVEIEVEPVLPRVGTGGASGITGIGPHTHLINYRYLEAPLIKKNGTNADGTPMFTFSQNLKCDAFGQNYLVLGGGYQLLGMIGQSQGNYDVVTNGPINQHTYQVDIADHSASVDDARIFAICAEKELAIDSGEPHF